MTANRKIDFYYLLLHIAGKVETGAQSLEPLKANKKRLLLGLFHFDGMAQTSCKNQVSLSLGSELI